MEHQEILNFQKWFQIRDKKWNIVNDQSNAIYDVGNEIIYNKEALKFTLCDYNDAYIFSKR